MHSLPLKAAFCLLCAVVILALVSAGSLAGRELASNCELYGRVVYKGGPAAVGTRIEAYAGSVPLADTTVREIGFYALSIPPDDPVTLSVDGWRERDELTLYVNGTASQPTVMAFEGSRNIDLTVQLISDVRKSTWGKIKALFR